jgi:hypothetical protein
VAEEKSKEEKKIRKINREGVEKMRGKQRLGFFYSSIFWQKHNLPTVSF